MTVRVAYVEEPPFYYTGSDGAPTGADIDLAGTVLRIAGATSIEFVPTTFGELLVGLTDKRWDLNVPIFVTPERAAAVAFSRPVWALIDGFAVLRGNPKAISSYRDVAENPDARLGVIPGQVQGESARSAGVAESQLVSFSDQRAAVAALLSGEIDVFAATDLGNRALAKSHSQVESLALDDAGGAPPVGAFSFHKGNRRLIDSVNTALRGYLGTEDHRHLVAKYGFGVAEIEGALRKAD